MLFNPEVQSLGRCFPAEGLFTYEVPGVLSELVSVITAVYSNYRRMGGSVKDAFTQVMPDTEQSLVGRSPAHV